MRKLSLIGIIFTILIPMVSFAQVFGQNQLIVSPFGSNGFVISTTTANGAKLSATSTPYFNRFSFTNASGTILTLGTLCLDTCKIAWPTTAASSTLLSDNNTFSGNTTFSTIKNSLVWLNGSGLLSSTSTPTAAIFNATSTTASSTFNGIEAKNLNLSGAATSTGANGFDITAGCFSISGSCLQQIISSASAYKQAVRYASTSTLPSNTYNNGVAGVGATLTGVANGPFYIDGNTPIVGDRVLVKNEGTGANNGIYTVTTLGIVAVSPFVLTRATDYNSSLDVFPGVANYVNSGTVNANTCWILSNTSAVTIGTTALTYTDDCGAGSFTGTYPIIITGTAISNAFGTSTQWTTGQVAYVNANGNISSAATTTLTGGGPITVSNSPVVLGSSSAVLGCTTATNSVAGCIAVVDWNKFNNQVGTTTANTWSGLQAFSNAGTTTFAGGLYATQIAAPYFNATSTATSTAGGGWNITGGCFSINGSCLSTSGAVAGGSNGMLTSWLGATTLTATSAPQAAYYIATSSNATSTFAGNILIDQVGSQVRYPNAPFTAIGTNVGALQFVFQNKSATATSSTDVIIMNDKGTNTSYYADLGINSSGNMDYNYPFLEQNAAYFYSNDGPLDFLTATTTASSTMAFYTGGTSTLPRLYITSTGNVGISSTTPGSIFAINNVLNATAATTSFSSTGGINLKAGCFAVATNCLTLANLSGQITLTTQVTGTLPAGNGGTGATSLGNPFTVDSNVLNVSVPRTQQLNASTTAWQAGTTTLYEPIIKNLTLVSAICNVIPLGVTQDFYVQFGSGTASTTMMVASSTVNVFTFTSNNTFTVGQTMFADFGASTTPIAAFKSISCTHYEK